jgi:hypothetical protein
MKRILISTFIWTIAFVGIIYIFGGSAYWQNDDLFIMPTIIFAAILVIKLFLFAFVSILDILDQ